MQQPSDKNIRTFPESRKFKGAFSNQRFPDPDCGNFDATGGRGHRSDFSTHFKTS